MSKLYRPQDNLAAAFHRRPHHMVYRVFVFFVILFSWLPPAGASEEHLRFSAANAIRYFNNAQVLLTEAYARLGLEFDVVYLPPNRSILQVENGAVDGELLRSKLASDYFRQILRVEVPITSVRVFPYLSNPEMTGLKLDEMKQFRIGHVAGGLFADEIVKGFPNVVKVETAELLFRMLKVNRIDIAIAAEEPGDVLMAKAEFSPVYKGRNQLGAVDLFHYLNRRHADLVPRLEEVLKQLIHPHGDAGFQNGR